jgi:hypothetical protein
VLLGVRERGVLLGVGRQHLGLVTSDVGVVKVPGQRGGDVEIPDLVSVGVAIDADDPVLGFSVSVGFQDDAHLVRSLLLDQTMPAEP